MGKVRAVFAFSLLFFAAAAFSPLCAAEPAPAVKTAVSWIDQNKATYNEVAGYIWNNPELSLVEFKSSAKLQQYLEANGFKIEKGVAGMSTAFVATWGSGKPVIGLMAEFDALPNLSQKKGVVSPTPITLGASGHGCGHDLFGTASATAGIAIAKAMQKHNIKGTVKVFGTPAEETLVGKVYMNRDGVFDGTDVMITWHPWDKNEVNYTSNLAMDNLKFRFYGKSAHAAAFPEAGRSALDGVELMDVAANYMREHVPQEARIHYVIPKGGEAPNVVPNFAEVWYFIRSPRRADVDKIRAWLIDISKGAAMMTQTTTDYRILTACYEYLPNRTLAKKGDEMVKMIGAPAFTAEEQQFGASVIKAMGKKIEGDPFSTKIVDARFLPHLPRRAGQQGVFGRQLQLEVPVDRVPRGDPRQDDPSPLVDCGLPDGDRARDEGGIAGKQIYGGLRPYCPVRPEAHSRRMGRASRERSPLRIRRPGAQRRQSPDVYGPVRHRPIGGSGGGKVG